LNREISGEENLQFKGGVAHDDMSTPARWSTAEEEKGWRKSYSFHEINRTNGKLSSSRWRKWSYFVWLVKTVAGTAQEVWRQWWCFAERRRRDTRFVFVSERYKICVVCVYSFKNIKGNW